MSVINGFSEGNVKWLSVEQIQESIKIKSDKLKKLEDKFLILVFTVFIPVNLVLVVVLTLWSADFGLSLWGTMLVNLPHLLIVSSLLMVVTIKDNKKIKVLNNDLEHLKVELLSKELGGELVDVPALSSEWNTVKIRRDNDVEEYMVRLCYDDNGVVSLETRMLQ